MNQKFWSPENRDLFSLNGWDTFLTESEHLLFLDGRHKYGWVKSLCVASRSPVYLITAFMWHCVGSSTSRTLSSSKRYPVLSMESRVPIRVVRVRSKNRDVMCLVSRPVVSVFQKRLDLWSIPCDWIHAWLSSLGRYFKDLLSLSIMWLVAFLFSLYEVGALCSNVRLSVLVGQ